MLHCRGGYFYVGHTDNLEHRLAQHDAGTIAGFTQDHLPVKYVWSQDFPTRIEALEAERRIKGWSKAKKMALIRGDWDEISSLAKNRQDKGSPSTGSGQTGFGERTPLQNTARPEPVEGLFLIPHPDTPCAAITAISVEVSQPTADQLALRYTVTGDIGALFVPPRKAPARINDLWKTTCFEVFIRPENGTAYHEFNFSPDTRWAAFALEGHRTGSRDHVVHRAPEIVMTQTPTTLIADCRVHLPERYTTACALGLTMVVEAADGAISYWALAHGAGAPDFHDANCFTARLPAFGAA